MKNITAVLVAIAMLPMTTSARAESSSLKTQTGYDIGLSLSSYKYQEPGYMSSKGVKMGLDLHTVKVLQNDLFVRGDLRYAFGTVDYNGSGSDSGEPDWYIEARGLVGKDWAISGAVLAAYTGVGYRYLFNDGRGITSTGYAGYRRESNYLYLPVGIIHRMAINDQARLESTLEYDRLLAGKQISRLSDAGLLQDITNNQNNGYGLKLSVMYHKSDWAIGPYADYWNIGQSDMAAVYNQNGTLFGSGAEPKNNTVEFGLKGSKRF
jgi:hypothetical protein